MIRLVQVQKAYRYVELLYEILQDRTGDPDINISHVELPTFGEHKRFVASEPYWYWYFVMTKDDTVIGTVYITEQNEIGIHILKDHRGKGFGKVILARLLADHEPMPAIAGVRSNRFIANINPNNARSIKLFTSMGAKLVQHTYRFD